MDFLNHSTTIAPFVVSETAGRDGPEIWRARAGCGAGSTSRWRRPRRQANTRPEQAPRARIFRIIQGQIHAWRAVGCANSAERRRSSGVRSESVEYSHEEEARSLIPLSGGVMIWPISDVGTNLQAARVTASSDESAVRTSRGK